MRKMILCAVLLSAGCLTGWAQTSVQFGEHYLTIDDDVFYGATPVDTTYYHIRYDVTMVADTLTGESLTYPAILLAGRRVWKYMSYRHFRTDSLMAVT